MAITDVFLNPPVERVFLEIRFPSLFYLESRIGEFQLLVISNFPESKLLFQKQFKMITGASDAHAKDLDSDDDESSDPETYKIWHFTSENGVELAIRNTSVLLSSSKHKTYDNPQVDTMFRDLIKFALDNFF